MPEYFRAVAVDYDGTLTLGGRPATEVLDALRRVRQRSARTILVTGRILAELLPEFPDLYEHFDAVVAENGAVLGLSGHERPIATRLPQSLYDALLARGVPVRQGSVILATDAVHDNAVWQACAQLGLDDQLVRNRGALMVLPAGVSKASGLLTALAELGISQHNAIGFGDAENDITLLEACEVGVAVGNAVPSLKQAADVVLEGVAGAAVARFLDEQFLAGLVRVQPARHRVQLGIGEDGSAVSVPASRIQLLIDGPSGSGKSYVAGLFAEGLIRAGYTLCVLDLEGDHGALGGLRQVLALGGREPLPSLDEVRRLVRHRLSSLVLDLSLREPAVKYAYARDVLDMLSQVRSECGLPNWIFVEEAHAVAVTALDHARTQGSLCLVTYHPDWLPVSAVGTPDVLISVEAPGRAQLCTEAGQKITFKPDAREVAHIRHRRKYADSFLPYERGFTFRDGSGAVGAHVVKLRDFPAALRQASRASIAHHAKHHDFSRWFRDVFQNLRLADATRRAEDAFHSDEVELFRASLEGLVALSFDGPVEEP